MTPKKAIGQRADWADLLMGWRRHGRGLESRVSDAAAAAAMDYVFQELVRRGYDRAAMECLAAHVADCGSVKGLRLGCYVADPHVDAGEDDQRLHSYARLAWYALRSVIAEQARRTHLIV